MRDRIKIGHSPDGDDAFMFYGMMEGKVDRLGMEFEHIIEDIESLNGRAELGVCDMTAVSVYNYSRVYKDYAMMRSGASVGEGYGPIIVGLEDMSLGEGKRIAVPGRWTSAYLTFKLYERSRLREGVGGLEVIFEEFDGIMGKVKNGEVDFGLLIHEGQLSYGEEGLKKILDLGEWWKAVEGLPLPLGVNVIRRSLGEDLMGKVSWVFQESIRYALENEEEALGYAMKYGRGLDFEGLRRFVRMYVNEYTVDLGERGLMGVRKLLGRGYELGLIGEDIEIELR